MTVKKALASLSDTDRKLLFIAFENEQAYYIRLSDNRFIGVNVQTIPNLLIEESAGLFSIGRIQ